MRYTCLCVFTRRVHGAGQVSAERPRRPMRPAPGDGARESTADSARRSEPGSRRRGRGDGSQSALGVRRERRWRAAADVEWGSRRAGDVRRGGGGGWR